VAGDAALVVKVAADRVGMEYADQTGFFPGLLQGNLAGRLAGLQAALGDDPALAVAAGDTTYLASPNAALSLVGVLQHLKRYGLLDKQGLWQERLDKQPVAPQRPTLGPTRTVRLAVLDGPTPEKDAGNRLPSDEVRSFSRHPHAILTSPTCHVRLVDCRLPLQHFRTQAAPPSPLLVEEPEDDEAGRERGRLSASRCPLPWRSRTRQSARRRGGRRPHGLLSALRLRAEQPVPLYAREIPEWCCVPQ
jgi:hypothetical protein